MLGVRPKTVEFRIKKPINGVPHSAYLQGRWATSDKAMIAKLRRMPDNKAEEIRDKFADMEITAESIAALSWTEVRVLGHRLNVFGRNMKRPDLEAAILGKQQGVQVA